MSRHRHVRDLDYDDYYDEHDDESDADPSSYTDQSHLISPNSAGYVIGHQNPIINIINEQRHGDATDSVDQLIGRVQHIVGEVFHVDEILIALQQAHYRCNDAADLLLEQSNRDQGAKGQIATDIKAEDAVIQNLDLNDLHFSPNNNSLFGDLTPNPVETIARPPPVSALAQALSAQVHAKQIPDHLLTVNQHTSKIISNMEPFQFDTLSPDASARARKPQVAVPSTKPVSTSTGVDSIMGPATIMSSANSSVLPPVSGQIKPLGVAALRKRSSKLEHILEVESDPNHKPNLNMIVVGHVDAGKSTLMGHLLFLSGGVSKTEMHRFEKESRDQGKASFMYAWVLDVGKDERSRGITVDVAVNHFETDHRRITLLDAPGHRDFIPNMIAGAAQADVALLVVDSTTGEFESGFSEDGQTKEHAILVRSLGISQIIIVVNKLDSMDWNQERFNEIIQSLQTFLKVTGFKSESISSCPCSGLTGENIVSKSDNALLSWYSGPSLLELIDRFEPPIRDSQAPLRFSCTDVYRSVRGGGLTVVGNVHSGSIFPQDRALVVPANQMVIIKSLFSDGSGAVTHGLSGDRLEIALTGWSIDEAALTIGSVLCDPAQPIVLVDTIEAKLVTLDNIRRPLLPGSQVLLQCQSIEEPCTLVKLIASLHKSTGEVVQKRPRAITKSSTTQVRIHFNRVVPLECFATCRSLGRFTLRLDGRTIAVGIVTRTISY